MDVITSYVGFHFSRMLLSINDTRIEFALQLSYNFAPSQNKGYLEFPAEDDNATITILTDNSNAEVQEKLSLQPCAKLIYVEMCITLSSFITNCLLHC